YELLLSESQERMLVVALRGREHEVRAILEKWDLTAAVIGEVIAEPVYRVMEGERVVAEFPGIRLVTDCPTYEPEARESDDVIRRRARDPHAVVARAEESDPAWTLEQLLLSPTIASKRWVFQQYDHTVRTSTVVGPGGDAAVVRIRGTDRAIALATDCNGRYVYLDPRSGARSAVAEAARNVACAGGRPMAITNNLNFGNPKRPEVYFQLREAVAGMAEACNALGTPVTGGNVSLYNENPSGAVYPTPVIGMVGVVESLAHVTRSTFSIDGDAIVLLGENSDELGASEYLQRVHGLAIGSPPACDLSAEHAVIEALLESIAAGAVRSAHDCSDGGLAVALAECAMMDRTGAVGAEVDLDAWTSLSERALLFGEAQSRVVVSTPDEATVLAIAGRHGVPARRIGTVRADSPRLDVRSAGRRWSATIASLAEAYHETLPRIMQRTASAQDVALAVDAVA
ncbi:MAG: phosphoribosylformylglycinamidine synthase II, partial [Gemmatimonadaceae bacterium]|nr:phosphoribosylformylglycinamidine synthase II [Gemmatimonadaceae bacterium]